MIFITGASKGIGKYLFERFTEDGESVYGTYNLTKPTENIERFSRVQIEDMDSVNDWINSINNKSKIVLINSAGMNYNALAHKADINHWKKVIDVNLIGTFNVIKGFLPEMRKNEFGRIINLSSVVFQTGVPGTSAYSASKAALVGLSKTLAKENGMRNITINNLNLGYFNIGIIREVPIEFRNKLKEKIPSSEFGSPNEIYLAIKYLIEAKYVNGASIDINGGLF